jgi:hypothetical protein
MPPPDDGGDIVDWDALTRDTGIVVPSDLRDFATVYGGGTINASAYIASFAPRTRRAWLAAVQDASEEFYYPPVDGVREWLVEAPHPLHPHPGGMIAWGGTKYGDTAFWLPGATDSEGTRTLVWNRSINADWTEFDGGVPAFLLAVLTHELNSAMGGQTNRHPRPIFRND